MPILSHMLIQKNNSQISIVATNLEVEITATAKYINSNEFDPITVPGRKFYEIIRSLDDQDIKISASKNKLTITTKNSSFKLSTLPANNFPSFEKAETTESFSIKQNKLLELKTKYKP